MKRAVIFDMYGVLLLRNKLLIEREDTTVTALLEKLKSQGMRLYLLSNIYVRDSAYFKKKYPFLTHFDKLYFSSDTGYLKPDRRAYELVLKENNLRPEDCIFFDDTRRNVEMARTLGIEAHQYTDHVTVSKLLGI